MRWTPGESLVASLSVMSGGKVLLHSYDFIFAEFDLPKGLPRSMKVVVYTGNAGQPLAQDRQIDVAITKLEVPGPSDDARRAVKRLSSGLQPYHEPELNPQGRWRPGSVWGSRRAAYLVGAAGIVLVFIALVLKKKAASRG